MMDWNDVLQLPTQALAGDRAIPKTQLVAQGGLTKTEEKKLKNVQALTFFASLSKANTYMLPVKDDTYDIEAIIVLRCVLRSSSGFSELEDVLHKAFPNPTMLLFEAPDNRVGVSVAIKRKSRAERGATVVENAQGTGLVDYESDLYAPFFDGLDFNSLPQTDLLSFVSSLATRCMLSRAAKALGFYPKCKEASAETLVGQVKELQSLQYEVAALERARRDKGITFAESTKIRMELNDKKQQRDQVAEEIREICHG